MRCIEKLDEIYAEFNNHFQRDSNSVFRNLLFKIMIDNKYSHGFKSSDVFGVIEKEKYPELSMISCKTNDEVTPTMISFNSTSFKRAKKITESLNRALLIQAS